MGYSKYIYIDFIGFFSNIASVIAAFIVEIKNEMYRVRIQHCFTVAYRDILRARVVNKRSIHPPTHSDSEFREQCIGFSVIFFFVCVSM